MREIDRRAFEDFGISVETLMERAGAALASKALKILKAKKFMNPKALVLAGGGNNGGDGFVAARILSGLGIETTTVLLKDPQSLEGHVLANFERLNNAGLTYHVLPKFVKIKMSGL